MVVTKTIRADSCNHGAIRVMFDDETAVAWACGYCSLRFYPACPTCIDIGHRNVVHTPPPDEVQQALYAAEDVLAFLRDFAERHGIPSETS